MGVAFRFPGITQILRERNRPFSQLVLGLNISQPGPEALNQIISKRGHLPRPDPLDTNSSRPLQHFRLDRPIGIFTSEMSEPVYWTVTRGTRKCRFAL